MSAQPRIFEVVGGHLTVHDLSNPATVEPGPGPTIFLVHGITANGLSWLGAARAIAAALPKARILAPDLRGRGGSAQIMGPFGLGAHVDDLIRVADWVGMPPLLVGHSMGGFVAALAAARHPGRFCGALLVDGGVSFPLPAAVDIDAALQAVIGPAMQRLSMSFQGPEQYLAFWGQHPAVAPLLNGPAGDDVRRYILHDLVRTDDGSWRSSCVLDAVRADGADVLADPETLGAMKSALAQGVPMEFLWAARGLLDEPQGLYDEQRLAALGVTGALATTRVEANHYSIISEPGTSALVAAVSRLAG